MRFTNPCTFDGRPLATVDLLSNVSGSLQGSLSALQESLSAFQGGNGYLASVAAFANNKVTFTKGDGSTVEVNFANLVKVANGSEGFLSVDGNVVKLAGVQDAINAAKQAAMDDASGKLASAKTELEGKINDAADKAAEDLASAKTELEGKITAAGTKAAEDLASAKTEFDGKIAAAKTELSGYVDTQIASLGDVFELKGYANIENEFLAPWQAGLTNVAKGDVYLVKETKEISSTNNQGQTKTESVTYVAEYVFIGGAVDAETSYEQIGGSVAGGNVGGYATVTYADTVAKAAKEAAIASSKTYTDEQIALVNADITANKEAIEKTVANNKTAIENTVSALTQTVANNKTTIEGAVATLTQTVANNKTAIEGAVGELTQTVADNKANAKAALDEAKVYFGTVNFGKDVNGEVEGRVLAVYDGGQQVYPQVAWDGSKSVISISEEVPAKDYEVIYVKAFAKPQA
jgi:hypothetical protein